MPYKDKKKLYEAQKKYRKRRSSRIDYLEKFVRESNREAFETYRRIFGGQSQKKKKGV